jgi:hypothetical protein
MSVIKHTSSIFRFGSGEMTVRLEKSTRLPDKFPLNRPCFPFSLCTNPRLDFFGCKIRNQEQCKVAEINEKIYSTLEIFISKQNKNK